MDPVDHYADRYWNDHPRVLSYLQRRATGDPKKWWMDWLAEQRPEPFDRGLVIGCGNGWVERDLIDRGVCREIDAFDAAHHYLDAAESERGDRPIHYFQADFTTLALPPATYDLVVNVSALHHAAHLQRVVAQLARALRPGGWFVNWDYVGPARNQYPDSQVDAMARVRDGLPERFRTPHPLRGDLNEMLRVDPTEAVHSDQILRAVRDWFEIERFAPLGGGIAYQLLWNFLEPFEGRSKEAVRALDQILAEDEAQTGKPGTGVPEMFAFWIATPRRSPTIGGRVRRYVREPVREALARRMGGLYFNESHEIRERVRAKFRRAS